MLQYYDYLSCNQIADSLGMQVKELLGYLKIDNWPKFKYEILHGKIREQTILSVLQGLIENNWRKVGADDNSAWQKGWLEVLERLNKNSANVATADLTPQYFQKHNILRYNGQYITTESANFLLFLDQVIRTAIFKKFLYNHKPKRIIELGCGTGNSQLLLARFMKPETELVAADWAPASLDIINLLSKKMNRPIKAVNFNMLTLAGKENLNIDSETMILTVHALEQLGNAWPKLFDFLMEKDPRLCVHIEPVNEFYNNELLFDYLALTYHHQRQYLSNWLTHLRKVELTGRIKIIQQTRLNLGDLFHEAYNLIVWKPIH